MLTNEEIEAGLEVLAADYWLPGRKAKRLAALVEDHRTWFVGALKRRVEPGHMIALLSSVGIRKEDGSKLSEGTLKSALSRKGIYDAVREEREASKPGGKGTRSEVLPPRSSAVPAEKGRGAKRRQRSRIAGGATDRAVPMESGAKSKEVARHGSLGALKGDGRRASSKLKTRGRRSGETEMPTGIVPRPLAGGKGTRSSNEDVLAYIRRTTRLRQRSGQHDD